MPNEFMREQWSKHGGPAWVDHHDLFERVYAPFNEAAAGALGPLGGLTTLDVGCGTGSLCQCVVDRGGAAVGVDISDTMIAGARELVPAARFEVADAQVDRLADFAPGGFDRVTSRFGVMFFDDSVAAFANIRAATKPDGRMSFVCWRSLAENLTFSNGSHVLVERMPDPPVPAGPGAPGPAQFEDPATITSILSGAGWADVAVEPFEAPCVYGRSGNDGVEDRLTLILTTHSGRLAAEQLRPALSEREWQELLDEVRADIRTAMVDGVVTFPGRTWLVTASNPA